MDVDNIPFEHDYELCNHLKFEDGELVTRNQQDYLPGQPLVPLEDSEVLSFVEKDILTPLLNQMSPWLWLLATPQSTHISALHVQAVRGRNIIITEDPEMHLLWVSNKIFIKPLPDYLLSHAFWSYFLFPDKTLPTDHHHRRGKILEGALGYVRTYLYLIRHESDLRIAKREYLVPEDIQLDTWMSFVKKFKYIEDGQVSGRYKYGDLRLLRLNFWARPILGRLYFRKVTWQYAEHFARYLAPLLFVFTAWSLILDSMQVGLQSRPHWKRFSDVSAWFSVASLIGVVAVAAFLLGAFCMLAGREILYAVGEQIKRHRPGTRKAIARRPMMAGEQP